MPLPDWLEPMAATLTADRFTDPAWTFERKLDGIRMLAFKDGPHVRLLSRNRLSLTASYPAVASAIARLPAHDAILDGEATGAWGRQGRADYHVFDLLWLNAQDVRPLPLEARRALLDGLRFALPLARVKPLVVGGYCDPRGRRVGLGALLVGYFEGDDFVFAGKVGTGLDTALLLSLRDRLEPLRVPTPPFTRGTGLPRAAHWVRPQVVVQVAFTEWTVHGKLRHPRLLGVRIDKAARQVIRERG